ncbi:TonB-dependent receptor [Aquitalea sp. FJL05]|uniref:TonB-dependent receptor domain-containing protein n=1 Tax=Aquitalea sp. FJL05 TaxID=2153366 RepID=UPI000F5B7456|nr:TonB-dependent receptor [Aquitalea sp. FJL05]RQO72776.1 TonB-dependent receptor [Aquitalea sp. FJL05]
MFKPQQIGLLVSLIGTGMAHADNLPQFQGEEVVVTASRQPQSITKTLSDISVITRDDIEQSAVTSLPQLLARQPGVEVVSSGGAGSQASIYLRGSNANQTVVLLDGVRIVSATTGTTALENIPLDNIERIEILRGSSSSLYGADAIGGVIQIFTRQGSGAPRFNAALGVGDHGLFQSAAGVAGKLDNTAFSLQFSQQQTNGISATNAQSSSYNPDRDPYRNLSYSANLTQTLAAGQELSLRLFQTNGKMDYDGYNSHGEDLQRSRQSGASLESKNSLTDNWTSTLRFSHSVDRQEHWTNGDMAQHADLYQTAQNEWLWQNDIHTGLGNWLAGFDYTQQHVDSSTAFDVSERSNKAVFIGYSGEFGKHLLQASARHDQDEQFGGKTTGQLGYGYRLNEALTARASYGTAFKAPTFNDLYYPLDSYGYAGNPHLQPETSRNAELALQYKANGSSASLTLFHNSIDNMIAITSDYSTMTNISHATIRGATLAAAKAVGNWDWSGSATYQDPLDHSGHQQLQRRARAYGQLAAAYDWGRVTTGLEWQVSAKRRDTTDSGSNVWLGGYTLTNLYANYRFAREWTANLKLSNVFDRHYTTLYGYNTAGLGGYIGVSYQQK